MKKIIYISATLALALLTASCAKELKSEYQPKEGVITFTASFEGNKVAVSETGKTTWAEGDEIAVSDGVGIETVTLSSGDISGQYATITVSTLDPEADEYIAVYPAKRIEYYEEGIAYLAYADTDPGLVCVSKAEDGMFSFKNVYAAIGFTAKVDADAVTIKAKGEGSFLDYVVLGADVATGEVIDPADEYDEITVPFTSGVFTTIPVVPGASFEGFDLTFTKGGNYAATSSSSFKLENAERGKLYRFGDISAKVSTDYYTKFQCADGKTGVDFKIGSQGWFKGTKVFLCNPTEHGDLSAYMSSTGRAGIYMLEPGEYNLNAQIVAGSGQAIVGRYSDKTPTVKVKAPMRYSNNKYGLMNVNFVANGSTTFNQINTNTNPESMANDGIYIDKCKFSGFQKLILSGSENQIMPRKIEILNSDYEVSIHNTVVISTNNSDKAVRNMESIRVNNSIFYSPTEELQFTLYIGGPHPMTEPSAECKTVYDIQHNNFINLKKGYAEMYAYTAKDINFKYNIFSDNLAVRAQAANQFFRFISAPALDPETSHAKWNIYYSPCEDTRWYTYITGSGTIGELDQEITKVAADPIIDIAGGNYASSNPNYGAQR